eukprot:8385728-Pyramimonas_sp.AAC.1
MKVEVEHPSEGERMYGEGIWSSVRSPQPEDASTSDDVDIVCELLSRGKTFTSYTRLQEDLREALHEDGPAEECRSPVRGVADACKAELDEMVETKRSLEDDLRLLGERMEAHAVSMRSTFDEVDIAAEEADSVGRSSPRPRPEESNPEKIQDEEDEEYLRELERVLKP